MAPIGVLGDVVARHIDQLPAEIAAEPPEQVTNWFRGKVGFRVRSVEFAEPQVHFLGARVSQVGEQQAAKLYYSVGDSRLTTVVFQAAAVVPARLHDDQLIARWGGHRAAHRAAASSRTTTYTATPCRSSSRTASSYAFTGDLDQQRLLQLVASRACCRNRCAVSDACEST